MYTFTKGTETNTYTFKSIEVPEVIDPEFFSFTVHYDLAVQDLAVSPDTRAYPFAITSSDPEELEALYANVDDEDWMYNYLSTRKI